MGQGSRSENYFVRLDVGSPPTVPPATPVTSRRHVERHSFEPVPARHHRARRRRVSGRSWFLTLLAAGLVAWFVWAAQQPGGVAGTVNGFIEHVRGGVEGVSAGPDVRRAVSYFNDQYAQSGSYPQLNEEQMTAAGIGIDIDVVSCGGQAVVLQTLTLSRLLLAGQDLGERSGRHPCPTDLRNPTPWTTK